MAQLYKVPVKWADKPAPEWCTFTDKQLVAWHKEGGAARERAAWLRQRYLDFLRCPIKFMLPHGKARGDRFGNDGVACLSDHEHQLLAVFGVNQGGKTYLGAAFVILRSMLTHRDWPIFAESGVDYHEWAGPREVMVATSGTKNMKAVWGAYRELLPRDLLGPYSPGYPMKILGETEDLYGRRRFLNFGDGKPKDLTLTNGTHFNFFFYKSPDDVFASCQADLVHFDEQGPVSKIEETSQRLTTRRTEEFLPQMIATLTPHVVPDRPEETGAAGWICRDVWDKMRVETKPDGTVVRTGRWSGYKTVGYQIPMDGVPDAIIHPETKRQKFEEWVAEPERNKNTRKIRAGRARYYAEPEVGGGLVYYMWDRNIHFIDPFDITQHRPCLYRHVDHGESPCAALWLALFPWGDVVAYREYYEFGLTIGPNAAGIIKASGNTRVRRATPGYEKDGVVVPRWDEVMEGEVYERTLLDGRSREQSSNIPGITIGDMYALFGLECEAAPCGHNFDKKDSDRGAVPLLRQWLLPDPEHTHILYRLFPEKYPKLKDVPGPRFYVFSSCQWFKNEIEGFLNVEGRLKGDDHLMDCAKWFPANDPYYVDRERQRQEAEIARAEAELRGRRSEPYTGY